ncbi:asparagine synthetase B family protein [Kamptonema animale CS-326]|jgi:asparagine synthase (glutamine-hydrolysing)|uniref:asparagine synthetase B family protein n=1 Tax=Kamptonema animale TaxID=92934 RepID=UPI00232F2DEB|nr:asparagine synthetase B family protein [Kamptonema animale]MDB9511115.1 asparagine synthetase B family protein [Kamptonema animale CS-326]
MGDLGKPSQFVGYWGRGDSLRDSFVSRTEMLRRLVPDYGIRESQLSETDVQLEWAIASTLVLNADQVTLNACGRKQPTDLPGDAWVAVEVRQLTLGRDPFGRVPLYWMQLGETIWFATRLQLLSPLIPSPQVSAIALHSYACFSYVPTPLTPIESIASVAAGTEMIWQVADGNAMSLPTVRSLHSAWQEAPQLLRREDEAIAQLRVLLQQAIARQVADLPIDEPVGVLLSGGIDSSLVTALLVEAGLQVRAYSLDFGVEGYSELPYAQQVADFLQIPLVRVEVTGDRLLQALGATAKALDLPYGDGTTGPLFLLKQAAARDVRVVFNGENGDQLFAGWTNKPLIANGVYNQEHPTAGETFEQQYLRTFQRFYGYESHIFSPALLAQIQDRDLSVYLKDAIATEACPSLLARLRRASLMLKGAQNIQPRATALGFACGLWVRSPFCDPDLTAWTFQLPGELLLHGACEKYILKKAADRWLPPEIVWREKRGMGVPLKVWYYREFWGAIGRWLNPNVLRSENRWQPYLADAMLSGGLGIAMRDRYIGNNLWLLLMWQAWRTEVLGEIPSKRSLDHVFWLPPAIGQRIWKYRRSLE